LPTIATLQELVTTLLFLTTNKLRTIQITFNNRKLRDPHPKN
jgi:hypothetical protein